MTTGKLKICTLTLLSFLLFACKTISVNNSSSKPEGYISSSDGVPIYYTNSGDTDNKTLVFIHCWGCNGTYWGSQIDYFAKSHQVITLDLAGHGLSGAERDNFTIEKFSEDVITIVNKLGLSNVVLIGHSLGALAAVEASLKLPEHIKGIIAIDTFETDYPWPKISEIAQVMAPFQKNFYKTTYPKIKNRFTPQTDKSLIYRIAKDIALAPPDIGVNSLENMYQWMAKDYKIIRSKLTTPLLLINAIQTKKPTDESKQIFYINYVGHYIPQEAPIKFNETLDQALQQLNNQ